MKIERLGNHAKFLSGFAFKSELFNDSGRGMPVIRIRDVVRGRSETYYSGAFEKRYVVSRGDYLIGMDGEFNLARWASDDALLNQRVCKIDEISQDIYRDYLARFLPAALKKIEDETPFVTVKHLSVKTLNEIEIPLPPLEEQKRIAGILDAADTLRAKRREGLAQLDTLLQSIFLDMFGDPVANPKEWKGGRLGDVLSLITYGLTVRPAYQATGIPLVSASQIRTGRIDLESAHKISVEDFERLRDKCKPRYGDVLFSKTGAIGHSALLQEQNPVALAQNVARLVFDESNIINLWALYYMRTSYIQGLSQRRAKGNAQKDLQLGDMEEFPIYIPPLELQRSFAKIVESVERHLNLQREHFAELDTLFASLQSRAFRGEL